MRTWIHWFDDIGMNDVPVVGGKNASLGEMRRALTPLRIRTPGGFATTAHAYRAFLSAAGLERVIRDALGRLERANHKAVQSAPFPTRSHGLSAHFVGWLDLVWLRRLDDQPVVDAPNPWGAACCPFGGVTLRP